MLPAISIRRLGKQYQVAAREPYLALRDIISSGMKQLFNPAEYGSPEKFWALKDIDLDIMPGERIGIIGRNGAGKSTLLKIISRITPPSTGSIHVRGRVGSLLEVGTGFHPELTGRENIYLNGSILGLKRSEINRQFDAIVDFSGVEKFLDNPLKQYSSGMQMRLAFAVAAHLESEILLVDEVLAVGDMDFQKKCLWKMEEVSTKEGRTVVFVSHNLSAISTLTRQTVLLDQGFLRYYGPTAKAIEVYTVSGEDNFRFLPDLPDVGPGITAINLLTSEGGTIQSYGKPMSVEFDIHMPEEGRTDMALAFQVMNRLNDQPVLHNWLFDRDTPVFRQQGSNKVKFTFPAIRLYKGNYYLRVHLAESRTKQKYQELECCPFQVEMLDIPEPEWGWYPEMCVYLDPGIWEKK